MIRALRTVFRPGILSDWLDRTIGPVSTIIVFGALTLAEHLRWPSAGIAQSLTVAALATTAEAAALWIQAKITARWATRISVAAACGAGSAFLLRSPGQWAFGTGLALISLALVIVAQYILRQIVGFAWRVQIARWQREEAETGVLSALLDLLGELIVPQQRRDADVRRSWMADLEHVAVIVERDLPYALRSGDPDTQSAIAAHARSTATALREMKQAVALPGGTAWQDLIKQLAGLTEALARHDFVSWPPHQPEVTPARPSRSLWRQAMDVGRNVLLIFGPALVAYLLPLVVPLSGPGLSWLRFASIVWALLGGLIALDPAWTDRMGKMRQGLDLLRNATPPKGAESSASPYGPAEPSHRNPKTPRGEHHPARLAHARPGPAASSHPNDRSLSWAQQRN